MFRRVVQVGVTSLAKQGEKAVEVPKRCPQVMGNRVGKCLQFLRAFSELRVDSGNLCGAKFCSSPRAPALSDVARDDRTGCGSPLSVLHRRQSDGDVDSGAILAYALGFKVLDGIPVTDLPENVLHFLVSLGRHDEEQGLPDRFWGGTAIK